MAPKYKKGQTVRYKPVGGNANPPFFFFCLCAMNGSLRVTGKLVMPARTYAYNCATS